MQGYIPIFSYFCSKNKKNIKNFQCLQLRKISVLHGRVFVMCHARDYNKILIVSWVTRFKQTKYVFYYKNIWKQIEFELTRMQFRISSFPVDNLHTTETNQNCT